MKKKAAGNAQKAATANEKTAFDQAEAGRKSAWEEKQASPQAETQRLSATMRLGRLLGRTGGRGSAPASLVAGLDALRSKPTYQAGGAYVAPKTGGGGWSFASDLVNAAGSAAGNYAAGKASGGGGLSQFLKGRSGATTPRLLGE